MLSATYPAWSCSQSSFDFAASHIVSAPALGVYVLQHEEGWEDVLRPRMIKLIASILSITSMSPCRR